MTIIEAIIYGLIQGLSEFLPISSSGHLVLFSKFLSYDGNFILFSVLLHLATLLAVVIYFRKEVIELIKKPFSKDAVLLYIATIPTVLLVLLFKGFVEDSFSGSLLPFCFIFTAVLLLISQILSKQNNKPITKKNAFIMGIAQGIATLPGISRSGSTICTGLILGQDKEKTAKFSFLMSIPIILASMAYELLKVFKFGAGEIAVVPTVIAFIVAFVSGFLSIKLMLSAVKKLKLYWFSIYLFIIGIISFFVIWF